MPAEEATEAIPSAVLPQPLAALLGQVGGQRLGQAVRAVPAAPLGQRGRQRAGEHHERQQPAPVEAAVGLQLRRHPPQQRRRLPRLGPGERRAGAEEGPLAPLQLGRRPPQRGRRGAGRQRGAAAAVLEVILQQQAPVDLFSFSLQSPISPGSWSP